MPDIRDAVIGPAERGGHIIGWRKDYAKIGTKLTIITALFCLISATVLPAPAASFASGLSVSPPAWDFGPIAADTRVEHTIILTNTGESDLSILSVSTSCHCLAAAASAASIPPGGGAELIVSFDPRGRTGSFTDFVIIRTDDPARPLQRIRITGRVEPSGEASPGEAAVPDALPPEAPLPVVEPVRPAPERTAGREPRADERGAGAAKDPAREGAMTVLFFYSPTCPDCLRLKERFLPGLLARHPEVTITYQDLLTDRGYQALLEAQRRLGRQIDMTPPLAIVGKTVLSGAQAIEDRLEGELDGQHGALAPPAKGHISVEERFKHLGLLAVAAGGLADGINPCAFTTLAFLLSYLALVGRKGKVLLLAGLAFAVGVFFAYFLVGLGLLEILTRIPWFAAAGRVFTLVVAGALGVLGLFSLRDFLRARRGRAAETKLQLGERLKLRIHRVIRERVRGRFTAVPSFAAGFLVALLEFPCTGQVYFPIVLMLRRIAPLRAQALLYLLLYNLLFILPLLAVFGLAYWGLTSERLAAAVRQHLGWAKLLLAVVFLGLGVLLFMFSL